MVNTRSIAVALIAIVAAQASARERTSEETLDYFLTVDYFEDLPPRGGDVFSQGKLDGVDYRKLLRGAVAYDRRSLVGIFRYTATRQLRVLGAEENCSILHALLEHWGDSRFASVLRAQPLRVREAVIAMLDHSWRYPGWRSHEFPNTFQLAKHQKIVTSPP
jgi:hypothetical protein